METEKSRPIRMTARVKPERGRPFQMTTMIHETPRPSYALDNTLRTLDNRARKWRRRVPPTRRSTPASKALFAARSAARLRLDQTAKALGVHPRTITRWEVGETRPSPSEWSRLVALFAEYAPQSAIELAAAAGVPSPSPALPPVDLRAVEAAIMRAADALDVAPRRIRAALRDIAGAVVSAHGTLGDLVRAAQDPDAPVEG